MTELVLEATCVLTDDFLPGLVVPAARRWARLLLKPGLRVRWGSLRRTKPLSANYGFERGLPIDRFFIEGFLAQNAEDIRGRVLEVRDAAYTRRYGNGRVTASEVVDIDACNPEATLMADLAEAESLPAGRYDCVILTQTLQYLGKPGDALRNVWQSLASGGTALITVPCLSRIDPDLPASDLWRFTGRGLETVLRRACPGAELDVTSRGNVLVGVAFLMGMAASELRDDELDHNDEHFPLVACARVRKPS